MHKMYNIFYDSIKEFVDDVKVAPKWNESGRNKHWWYNWEKSGRGSFNGKFTDIVDKIEKHDVKREASMLAGVMNEINCADFTERAWEYRQRLEEGDIIDVNRYLDGHEKFWCGVKRCWRTKQVVRVYCGFGGNCGRSRNELAVCGAVCVTLCEILESMGIGVELWGITTSSGLMYKASDSGGPDYHDGETLIKLKASDEFADLGLINFITGTDYVFRNGVFRSWCKLAEREGFTLDSGLGHMKTPNAKDIGLEDCEADTAIIVPQLFDVGEAKKWLTRLLEKLPEKMGDKKKKEDGE